MLRTFLITVYTSPIVAVDQYEGEMTKNVDDNVLNNDFRDSVRIPITFILA